jgi:hypothetical protein
MKASLVAYDFRELHKKSELKIVMLKIVIAKNMVFSMGHFTYVLFSQK